MGPWVVRWPFINEIMFTGDYWLLFSAVTGFGVPRDAFGSEAEERAFVSALLDHLEPAARARSSKAEKLLSNLNKPA